MATLNRHEPSGVFRVRYRFGGRQLFHSLKTTSRKEAEALKGRLEETIRLVERGRLELPPDADLITFLLSDGRVEKKPTLAKSLTLGELFRLYADEFTAGAKEGNTRGTEGIHAEHLKRHLGTRTPLTQVTTAALQDYVARRTKERWHGRAIGASTVKKELATLRTVWAWAARQGHTEVSHPGPGVTLPKGKEKPPFRTYEQIEAIVARGGLGKKEARELWDGLFLDAKQVAETLEAARRSRSTWFYPFLATYAHTVARKSELLRARVEDFDFERRTVHVREKKRDRTKETFRTVDMTAFLESTMRAYFAGKHPGGSFAFSLRANEPVAADSARETFRWALWTGRWAVLRGYHVFRHSFASNMAAAGVDPRVIDDLIGHQTEEMRNRYRHLFPAQRRRAMVAVFGE